MTRNPHEIPEDRERWENAYCETRRSLFLRRWRIRSLIDARKDGILIDLGSGDGLNLRILDNLGFEHIVAFDYSPKLLRMSRWPFCVAGDAHKIPFRSGSIETILVDSALHHMTNYQQVAHEIARVLKPGGRFYVMEPRPSTARMLLDKATLSPMFSRLRLLNSRKATLIEEWDLHYRWLEKHGEMERLLGKSGLRLRYRRHGVISLFLSFEKPFRGSKNVEE